jgi:predicted nucleic acid-binding Zn ribbon protein
MAKSKAPVFYCKWCEEVLKKDCQFCSEPCRQIWTKTRRTPAEVMIQNYQSIVDNLKKEKIDVSETCKENYLKSKKQLELFPEASLRIQITLYAHIYNKKKDKAFKTFEKLKRLYQDKMDGWLFEGKTLSLAMWDGVAESPRLSGEESIRVDCVLVKLDIQQFELMLQQTF